MKITLRRKIILTFFVFLLVGGAFWSMNYFKQRHLERTIQILEKEHELLNTILEARRYEKNFFLTMEYRNLDDALSYVRGGEQALSSIMGEKGPRIHTYNLNDKLQKLRKYKGALTALSVYYEDGFLKLPTELMENLVRHDQEVRSSGKQITGDVELMLKEEGRYLSRQLTEARTYHFIALAAILSLCVFTALYLVFNVIRPLKSIEHAIDQIARGDFENIPALSTGDEFASLVTSLNHMIEELNRRSEQLVQREKMASLGTLTSGVAHELNNPLNNISTSIQILMEESDDADREYHKELLRETEHQVDRARDIVKALLEFARDTSFSPRPVRLKDLVEKTLKLIKGEVPANVSIELDIPDGITAELDPRRIQQVLINLIINGVQAMDGNGSLDIVATEMPDGHGFYLQVKDSGEGIPQENLPKIFEPFFTTKDSGHKDVGEGSGLGLSVCHGIIEQHGGRIEVESEQGKGTTFTIFLAET
ncbi:MAG: HAMP domain-containing protein [Deltaproteobacteria bacterium]|nr:HAMP domain-containing protein [Deltaproteobacteria bacterium]